VVPLGVDLGELLVLSACPTSSVPTPIRHHVRRPEDRFIPLAHVAERLPEIGP